MNTKYLFTAIAVVVVLVIGLFIFNQKNKSDISSDTNTTVNTNTLSNDNANANSIDTNANGNTNTTNANANTVSNGNTNSIPDGNDVAVFEVSYNGKSFSPSNINAKIGDVVIFKNDSSGTFWPASDPHPTHTGYPGFDAKAGLDAGKTYQFKFTKAGTWGYHDHLNPTAKGTITVK